MIVAANRRYHGSARSVDHAQTDAAELPDQPHRPGASPTGTLPSLRTDDPTDETSSDAHSGQT
jgi:hypothetical protein